MDESPWQRLLHQHWFIGGYLVVLVIAFVWPELGCSDGLLHLNKMSQKVCVAGVFFCTGLVLPNARLSHAARAWQPHLVIQGLSFVLAPALAVGVAWIGVRCGLPPAAATGLIILGCLPTTIGSCVALTGVSGGNEAITLINCVLSNLLGVVVTPLLILFWIGREGSTPVVTVIQLLLLIAVLPAILGQCLRLCWARVLEARKLQLSLTSGGLILLVLLTIFSDIAQRGLIAGFLSVTLTVISLYGLLGLATWLIAPLASRDRSDRVAMYITASQKTAAVGIPLINMMFAGDPLLSLIILPVAIYHVVQQLFSASMSSAFKAWVTRAAPLPPPPAR